MDFGVSRRHETADGARECGGVPANALRILLPELGLLLIAGRGRIGCA